MRPEEWPWEQVVNMIKIESKGDFKKSFKYFETLMNIFGHSVLDKYGEMGVSALSSATPEDTGLAKSSWRYEIVKTNYSTKIIWHNDDIEGGCNVAILLQYGHGTKNGGYVQGRDYINPAIQPIFDKMANDLWEEVTRA